MLRDGEQNGEPLGGTLRDGPTSVLPETDSEKALDVAPAGLDRKAILCCARQSDDALHPSLASQYPA